MSTGTFCRLYYRIPFSETDAMKIVHHSNHAKYLERGRIEFLRLTGLDYVSIMKRGFHYPLVEIRTVFKKPLVFDEVILIETAIVEVSRARLDFAYKIYSVPELAMPSLSKEAFEGGKPSVLGETFHCCVNDEGRPVAADAEIVEQLKTLWGKA
jgi:YbgC/YbaW family acyl-CoA thioester hydrolase